GGPPRDCRQLAPMPPADQPRIIWRRQGRANDNSSVGATGSPLAQAELDPISLLRAKILIIKWTYHGDSTDETARRNSAANPLPTAQNPAASRLGQSHQAFDMNSCFAAARVLKRIFPLPSGTDRRESTGANLLADQGQDERALMRRGAMLEEEDALPDAELEPAVGDGDRQLRLGQRTLDVRRHVVRPLVVVAVEAHILRHDPAQERVEIVADVGRGILLDQERGRGVLDVGGQQTGR